MAKMTQEDANRIEQACVDITDTFREKHIRGGDSILAMTKVTAIGIFAGAGSYSEAIKMADALNHMLKDDIQTLFDKHGEEKLDGKLTAAKAN